MEQKHLSIKDAAGLKSRSWDYGAIAPVVTKASSRVCVSTQWPFNEIHTPQIIDASVSKDYFQPAQD